MASKSTHKTSLVFIFITILIDVIGIGIIIPVIPSLIENLTDEPLNVAARWSGWLIMAFSAAQFLFAPLMGELSDRFGRKPILLIALAGLGVDYYFHAVAPTIGWLFVGRVLAGTCGASFTVATAYIADISTRETKAKNFGLVGAAFGLGFMIGPAIGGGFATWGIQVPFYAAACFSILNFLFGLFLIPESLGKDKRRKINWSKTIPGVSLFNLSKFGAFFGLILAFILVALAGQVMPTTWAFYTKKLFNWEDWEIGISLMVIGLLVGIVQGGLIGWSTRTFGNKKVIMFGFIAWTMGMTAFTFAFNEIFFYMAIIPYVLGGVAGPTIQGVLSNRVQENEQGNLQGMLTGMVSLTAILGPLIYSNIFYVFNGEDSVIHLPGAPFAMGGFILIIATIIAYFSLRRMGNIENNSDTETMNETVTGAEMVTETEQDDLEVI